MKLIGAVGAERSRLPGMPVLVGDPASAVGRNAQDRGVGRGPGEDAVRVGVMRIQVGIGDISGAFDLRPGAVDALQGESAEAFAVMAPRVQVPATAVAGKSLGGLPPIWWTV